jgi:hypothetical protein
MKKLKLLAVAAALMTVGTAANASGIYSTTFTSLTGHFEIAGFGVNQSGTIPTTPDADHVFTVTLTNVDGKVAIDVPPANNYTVFAKAGSSFGIDFDGVPGFDLGTAYAVNTAIGTGPLTITNTSTTKAEFDFNGVGTTSLKLDGVNVAIPYTTGGITISGSAATTLFGTLLGLGPFLVNPVSGTVDVVLQAVQQDSIVITDRRNQPGWWQLRRRPAVPGQPAGWSIRSGLPLATVTPSSTAPSANGALYTVPEPATLALLGLGAGWPGCSSSSQGCLKRSFVIAKKRRRKPPFFICRGYAGAFSRSRRLSFLP